MFLFLDLETTGLDARRDVVLEVGAILTDERLHPISTFERVVQLPESFTHPIDAKVVRMHVVNGLWPLVFDDSVNHKIESVDQQMFEWLCAHPRQLGESLMLAGNSVWFDRSFMVVHMPTSYRLLHYRQIDVTTINEFYKLRCPGVYETRPTPGKGHRALADADESLRTFKHYVGTE